MKEADWNDCIVKNTARKITPDKKRAESLKETAHMRIQQITYITEQNCNFVFEDYYISLLELLQAQAFTQGYNILNHVCIGFYIRDVLKREDLYMKFDDVRYKRNSLTYYGSRMDYNTAKQAIQKCKRIIKEIET